MCQRAGVKQFPLVFAIMDFLVSCAPRVAPSTEGFPFVGESRLLGCSKSLIDLQSKLIMMLWCGVVMEEREGCSTRLGLA
jgi:hypothetical protein